MRDGVARGCGCTGRRSVESGGGLDGDVGVDGGGEERGADAERAAAHGGPRLVVGVWTRDPICGGDAAEGRRAAGAGPAARGSRGGREGGR
jgi:hypothetical protein